MKVAKRQSLVLVPEEGRQVSELKLTARMSLRHGPSENARNLTMNISNCCIFKLYFCHLHSRIFIDHLHIIFKTLSEIGNWPTVTPKWRSSAMLVRWVCHTHWEANAIGSNYFSGWWAALVKRLGEWGWWGVFCGAEADSMGSVSTRLTPQLILGPKMKKAGVDKPETTQAWQEDQHKYWRLG